MLDTNGVLHIEAPKDATFTLGQVFAEWGVALSPGRVGAYRTRDAGDRDVGVFVNGKRSTGHPARIPLRPHQEIAVVVRSPRDHVQIPASYEFVPGE